MISKMSQLMCDYRFGLIRAREENKIEHDLDKFQIRMNAHTNDIMANFRKNIKIK